MPTNGGALLYSRLLRDLTASQRTIEHGGRWSRSYHYTFHLTPMLIANEPDVESQQDPLLPRTSLNEQPPCNPDESVPLVRGGVPARRLRPIWALVAVAVVLVLVLGATLFGFLPGEAPSAPPAALRGGWSTANATYTGQIRLGRKPRYHDPFNPDDLTFTEEQCDAYFPDLWKEIDRSVAYYSKPEHAVTWDRLERVCSPENKPHLRVLVYNNRLYIKYYRQSDFTRTQATLALLYQSVLTSREPVPNVEFCIGLEDWSVDGLFGLDRRPYQEDVWLLPDYIFFDWPEHTGTYHHVRQRMAQIDARTPWNQKVAKLFWRGSMSVGTVDREPMLQVAKHYNWSDIQPITWGAPPDQSNVVPIDSMCQWKFQAVPDGNAYTGKLLLLQNCKTVIVTHRPRWIQHWSHLWNGDWSSPDQNIVLVPFPSITPLKGEIRPAPQAKERTWDFLPQTMRMLLRDDAKAEQIATNSVDFFRNRYVSPASAACYYRRLLKGYASVIKFTPQLHGNETSYESWSLRGMRQDDWRPGVQ